MWCVYIYIFIGKVVFICLRVSVNLEYKFQGKPCTTTVKHDFNPNGLKFHRGSSWVSILSWLNLKTNKDYFSYEYIYIYIYTHIYTYIWRCDVHTYTSFNRSDIWYLTFNQYQTVVPFCFVPHTGHSQRVQIGTVAWHLVAWVYSVSNRVSFLYIGNTQGGPREIIAVETHRIHSVSIGDPVFLPPPLSPPSFYPPRAHARETKGWN